MDAFLAKVGTEFDASFIKLHVGTDDLDELVEFTWEKSDLAPLVDAGLKPLLRNKLYRAILEERAARSNCVGAAVDASSNYSTGMPSSASLNDANSEVPSSEIQDDASSLSQVEASLNDENSEVPSSEIQDDASSLSHVEALTTQVASLEDVCTSVDPGNDSSSTSSTPRSQTSVPTDSFEGFCSVCGEYGHKISECKADWSKDAANFPALGVAGKRPVVPQAQVSVNQLGERERRQAAQKQEVAAKERAEKDRRSKAAEAQAKAARERFMQCHYCQGKGHRLQDCPKRTADLQEAARQRAQEARDRAEREKQRQEEAKHRRQEEARKRQEEARKRREEEARQRREAQTRGYGRQFGSDQSSYAYGRVERRWQTMLAGKWRFFDDKSQIEFERAYAAGSRIHKFNARGWNYDVDFNRMVQVNLSTSRERPVRRLEDADSDGDSD